MSGRNGTLGPYLGILGFSAALLLFVLSRPLAFAVLFFCIMAGTSELLKRRLRRVLRSADSSEPHTASGKEADFASPRPI